MLQDFPAPAPAESIVEVIQTMQTIQATLDDSDGLKWFNYLYLAVTQSVQANVAQGVLTFSDPAWVSRLDVAFANLYFAAIVAVSQNGPDAAPRAWRPLFEDREESEIARIQFALAGMNAHINRDLVAALLMLYRADGAAPNGASPRYQDFVCVNQLLDQVETQARGILLVGTPLEYGDSFAPLEDIIAMWNVKQARSAAWQHSQSLWQARALPDIAKASFDALDGLTELASRGLLLRILP